MMTFTEDELLQMLKQRMGIATSACGAEVVTLQGGDIDSALRMRLQAAYLELLQTAPPILLPTQEIAMQAASFSSVADGVGRIDLPESVLRPVEIKLPEWPHAVTRFVDAETPEAEQIRLNRYSRSTERPKAVLQGQTLWVYDTIAETRILPECLRVILYPAAGSYTLDIRLLQQLLDNCIDP